MRDVENQLDFVAFTTQNVIVKTQNLATYLLISSFSESNSYYANRFLTNIYNIKSLKHPKKL